jgi:endogenous inhibitor of DNA gyrase (YacG/DUF329 family)
MESQQHICPSCGKQYERFKGISWAFGTYCSRSCQDSALVQWLNTQYCQYGDKAPLESVEKRVD